jgi:hypothetical protein
MIRPRILWPQGKITTDAARPGTTPEAVNGSIAAEMCLIRGQQAGNAITSTNMFRRASAFLASWLLAYDAFPSAAPRQELHPT